MAEFPAYLLYLHNLYCIKNGNAIYCLILEKTCCFFF